MFNQPSATGDAFNPKDHPEWLGKLVLAYPTSYEQGIPTTFGEKDAVKADIVFLDLPDPQTGQPFVLSDALIFSAVIVGQLKNSVPDGMVLGRLMQGQNTKGNPPWMLADFTPQDEAIAKAYVTAHPRSSFNKPQAQGNHAVPAAAIPPQAQAVPQPPAQQGWPVPQQGYAPAPQAAAQGPMPGVPGASPVVPPNAGVPVPGVPQYAQAAPSVPGAMAAPATPAGPDANTLAFLGSKGIDASGMAPEQAQMIASTYPDYPANQ